MLPNIIKKPEFAVRSRPKTMESAQGYLLRLAVSNGRYELTKLAQSIEYNYKTTSFYLGGDDFESFIQAISIPLRLSGDELLAMFLVNSWTENKSRSVCDIRLPTPKICPECMRNNDTRYIRETWEYAHNSHCEDHEIALIDRCPHCLESLSWSGDIFVGCPCCNFKWENYKTDREALPVYQSICNELTDSELTIYLSALYQNFIFVCRPFDLSFDKFKKLPKDLFNISFLFKVAFAVTMNDAVKENWEAMRLSHFNSDLKLNCLDEYSLQTLAKIPWAEFSCEHIKTKFSTQSKECFLPLRQREMVSSIRAKNSKYASDYQYHISLTKAANLIGVTREKMNGLVELNLVSAYSGSLTSRARIVSGSSVAKFIAVMIKNSAEINNSKKQLISLKSLEKILPYFNCNLPILTWIISTQKCQTYLNSGVKFSLPSLLVDRGEIAFHLEKFFVESIKINLSRSKLRQICSIGVRQFMEFKVTFNLQEVGTTGSLTRFNPVQLSAFFDKYVLINRWAKITGVGLKSIVQFLKGETGLVANPILEHQDIFIFEKSDQLLESLTKYLLYHRKEINFLNHISI